MYLVSGLLLLVTLLVRGSLGLVGRTLLLRQGLPPLTEKLADVTCIRLKSRFAAAFLDKFTELDTGVVLTDLVTLLVGKEHVRRETTLGRVGVYHRSVSDFEETGT